MAAPKAQVLGKQKKADLDAALFGEPFHESLVHETAIADLAARRRGTASTLTRAEVSMTTAKAWRQKGTGRARAGALSTPQRTGGGVAFGPKPRDHSRKVNRKARRRALRCALSVHAQRGTLAVLDADALSEPSTKRAAAMLRDWEGADRTVLVLVDIEEVAALKSFRNIERVTVQAAEQAGVADVIGHRSLVLSRRALEQLRTRAARAEGASA
jgi:large subunit ribosomal protein L4